MKVGDLVRHAGKELGIVIRFWAYGQVDVLFADGEYNVLCKDLEVINESR